MLVATGCGSVSLGDFDDSPSERDTMSGPGLFSGEKGYISIGGDKKESASTETDPKKPVEYSSDQFAEDFKEFEAYQRWKKEERHSKEYEEFKEWQRFQQWKLEQKGDK